MLNRSSTQRRVGMFASKSIGIRQHEGGVVSRRHAPDSRLVILAAAGWASAARRHAKYLSRAFSPRSLTIGLAFVLSDAIFNICDLASGVSRPTRQATAVGITGLGEIRPVCAHHFRHRFVFRSRGGTVMFPELPEHVRQFLGMGRTIARTRRLRGVIGVFVEVIEEDLGLAGLRLQSSPYPRVPAKSGVTCEVTRRLSRQVFLRRDRLQEVRRRTVRNAGARFPHRLLVSEEPRTWRLRRSYSRSELERHDIVRPDTVCTDRLEPPTRPLSATTIRVDVELQQATSQPELCGARPSWMPPTIGPGST